MSEYSSSTATRQALINAAGELFAERGVDAVTTRDIAEAAGENKGLIHYHFGGKDGLLTAVLERAASPWKDDPVGKRLETGAKLLESDEGQERLLSEMLDAFCGVILAEEVPFWCSTLVFRMLQKDGAASEQVFAACVKPSLSAFMKLYALASGDEDLARACAWSEALVSAFVMMKVNPNVSKRFLKADKASRSYNELLKEQAKAGALQTLRKAKAVPSGAAL